MALSKPDFLKDTFNSAVAGGDKIIASDAMFVIDGYENFALQIKAFPQPVLSAGEGIEIPLPMGSAMWQHGQAVTYQQASITMTETVPGVTFKNLLAFINDGGYFNAKVYEGTKEEYLRYYRLQRCFIQLDPAERDWESRTQVLQLQGNLFYHYFGEMKVGNLANAKNAFTVLNHRG